MRFILLNQYYPPDVAPTGVLLSHVAEHLAQSGHDVTVLCSKQRYGGQSGETTQPKVIDGLHVRPLATFPLGKRFHHKLLHYGSFYALLAWKLLTTRRKPDVVIALTTPPYLGLLANIVGLLRSWHTIDWIMDLYPDVMKAHGMIREESLTYRFLQRLQRWSLRRSKLAITLGPDMQARVAEHYDASSIALPLWAERRQATKEAVQSYRHQCGWDEESTVFLYSGNLGLGHRFDEWLTAIAELGPDSPITWVFSGKGAQRGKVEAFVQEEAHGALPIHLTDYVSEEDLAVHLAAGDVHLASLDPPWDGCMVPSKLQGSFAAGRPILFIGSKTSSLGQWITASGGGWVVAPDDAHALHSAIKEALAPNERRLCSERALAYARDHFDRAKNIAAFQHAIMKAISPPQLD